LKKLLGVPQELNWGFIIICVDSNHINLENTIKSIRSKYENASITCVYGQEIKDFNLNCEGLKFVKSKENYAAMINSGMNATEKDWNIIFIAGTYVQINYTKKYSMFIESDSDVLFPNYIRKSNFIDGTINGLCINRKLFKKTGEFNENCEKIEHSKAEWGYNAIPHNVKFKAICHLKST
jgi:hypothetical protein